MARREPSWDELRTFFEVVRDGSLSGAARRLGLTQPTVGRHIDALEDALGLALFTRSPRGLTPTPAAVTLAPHGEAMAAAAAALSRSASSEAALDKGAVRVTASEIVGCEVLPSIFADFRAKHPGVAIELAVTNRNEDLGRGDADIAVRMVRPTQSGLVARRIGATRIGLYARRDYCDRFGAPRSLAALRHHGMIGSIATAEPFVLQARLRSNSPGRISAFAATAIWRSWPRSAPASASAAARRALPGVRTISSRFCPAYSR